MDYRAALVYLARTYATATNRSVARVSTLVRNHGGFFDRLERGQGCTMDTFFEVLEWFERNWPAGTVWPRGVPTTEQIRNIGLCAERRPEAEAA